jgi:iron uptake system component EfeO
VPRSLTPRRRGLLAVPVLLAAGGLLAGCVSQSSASGGGNPSAANGSGGDGGSITVNLTADGCQPSPATAKAGVIDFKVANKGADKVSEAELQNGGQMLGEQENLSPGLSGGFSLHLDGGDYQIYCPGATKDTFDFKVTGQSATSWKSNPALVKATQDYATWTISEVNQLVPATKTFTDAVIAGDMTTAETAYGAARVFYERIEPVAEIWGTLDADIDGRIDDAATPADFKGFHKIEQMLFQQHTLTGAAPIATELQANVVKLQQLVAKATYQPAEIANGATDLINEIQSSKVTGEEERYSHIDLLDFQGNLDGAMEAVDVLGPALQKSDPDLYQLIQDRDKAVETALQPYVQKPGYLGTGYVDYSTVTPDQRKSLSQAVNALAEEVSKVSEKVA